MARFGPYELIERIGHGGMGEVYRAVLHREGAFEKPVVIKRILPSLSADSEFQRLFNREARIAALLNHQHVVQVYDFGRVGDEYFLAMELVDGADLRTLTERLGRPPLLVALAILRGVGRALDYAHRRRDAEGAPLGLVHRDVSPGNVLLSREGEVKLTDFGLVTGGPAEESDAGTVKGKFAYMSPEQTYGDPVDARSDLFSWGVLAYELLSGRQPFEGPVADVLNGIRDGRYDPLPVAPWPRPLVDLVHHCLRVHRDDRPERAGAVLEALDAVIADVANGDLASATSAWVRKGLEAPSASAALERTEVGDAPLRPTQAEAAPEPSRSEDAPEAEGPLQPTERRRAPGWLLLALVAAAALAGLAVWLSRSVPVEGDWPPPATSPPQAERDLGPPEGARSSSEVGDVLQIPARLLVLSEPASAQVLLDDAPAGLTPAELVVEPPGPHDLRVQLEGYVDHAEVFLARPGVEAERMIALRPLPRLTLEGTPPGATALVTSGAGAPEQCEVPCELAVEPGEVTVRIEHPGYVAIEPTVAVEQSQTLRFALDPEPIRLEATWRSDDLEIRGGRRLELGPEPTPASIDVTAPGGGLEGSLRATLRASPSGQAHLELTVHTRPWSTVAPGWSGPPRHGVVDTPAVLRLDGLDEGRWPFELRPAGEGAPLTVELVLRAR